MRIINFDNPSPNPNSNRAPAPAESLPERPREDDRVPLELSVLRKGIELLEARLKELESSVGKQMEIDRAAVLLAKREWSERLEELEKSIQASPKSAPRNETVQTEVPMTQATAPSSVQPLVQPPVLDDLLRASAEKAAAPGAAWTRIWRYMNEPPDKKSEPTDRVA